MKVGLGETAFRSHEIAASACRSALSCWFDVFDEVRLLSGQVSGQRLRIDQIIVARNEPRYILGIEVKCGFYRMSEYARAIKQASDYRHAVLDDERLPEVRGFRLAATSVFPRWHGGHDAELEYKNQALGMEILAHHFRVGFADYDEGGVALTMNDQRIWSSGAWSGNAAGILDSKDAIGSLKLIDPLKL